jgi:lysozyme
MKTNKDGIELIKEFEGFRSKAYRCPAGVLTIGYGHTSAAGSPLVKSGMTITRDEGEAILKRDLEIYEAAVLDAIKVELNSNQFSACASLCYNIGPGNFKKSSVARFCNKRQWENAADAFALWNKAGGKVLPGLVRRRAAEQALFLKGTSSAKEETRPEVETPIGKSMTMSTTNIAAGATATAGVVATVKETVDNGKHIFTGLDVNLVLIAIILAGAGWIIYQRYRKARDWDV